MPIPKINFASTKLAFILIGLVLVHLILSALIPQSEFAEEQVIDWQKLLGDNYEIIDKLALDRIYSAPPFFVILALLATNLVVGNINRFKSVYRSGQPLLKARHLGSIIFHFSLVLIMSSIILNYLFKFEAVFALTEGQTATDSADDYHRVREGPLYSGAYDRFQIRLEEISALDSTDFGSGSQAVISLRSTAGANDVSATTHTNKPLIWNDLEFHYGLLTGYSPEISMVDSTGENVMQAILRLAAQRSDGKVIHADFVELPTLDARLKIEVVSHESESDSAIFIIEVEKRDRQVYVDTVGLNQTVGFEDNELTITGLRRWCYVDVVISPFLNLLFFGFWLGLSGMVIGFVPRVMKSGAGR
jgi:hypothetical protein